MYHFLIYILIHICINLISYGSVILFINKQNLKKEHNNIILNYILKTTKGPRPPDDKPFPSQLELYTNNAPPSASLVSYMNNNSNFQLNNNESKNSSQINSPCQENSNNSTGSESSWFFAGATVGDNCASPHEIHHHDNGFEWFFHRNKVSSKSR